MVRENAANIPNLTCISGKFELAICITNGSEWLSAEMGRINQERLEDAENVCAIDNTKAPAAVPPTAPDTSNINYTCVTKTDCEPYPKLTNSGKFVIDTNKSTEVIIVDKIKHNMKLKEYAAYTVVDSVIQHYLRKVFETEIFTNMLTSDNFVLNKYTVL